MNFHFLSLALNDRCRSAFVVVILPFHDAMPIEWSPCPAMAPSTQQSNTSESHPNWTSSVCDRWPWSCAPWQTNPWVSSMRQPAHDDDGLEFGPTPCSSLRCVSWRPWPFHGDRPVPLGMDTKWRGNLRRFSSRVSSVGRLGRRWWTPTCRHCHPKRNRQAKSFN